MGARDAGALEDDEHGARVTSGRLCQHWSVTAHVVLGLGPPHEGGGHVRMPPPRVRNRVSVVRGCVRVADERVFMVLPSQ